jgi:hypothetical protein
MDLILTVLWLPQQLTYREQREEAPSKRRNLGAEIGPENLFNILNLSKS